MTNIYQSPDIRKQTIAEAEKFINAKRVRRLVLLSTYQEKKTARLSILKDKELASFKMRADRVEKAMEKVKAAINTLENCINSLANTNTALTNIEHSEVEL